MYTHSDVAIIIPSRLGSERLKQKPLQLIGDKSMIAHVVNQVQATGLKNIYVATDSELVANEVIAAGGKYIMTNTDCSSGTDRVYEALQNLDHQQQLKYVINVQGDMPFIEASVILNVIACLKKSQYGIITPVVKVGIDVASSSSNVKVVVDNHDKALYFSRSMIPFGAIEFLYHIGIYGFHKDTLEKFVKLPQSALEIQEKLEQLRALQHDIDIGICYVDDIPISVDTIDDLNKAIEHYNLLKLST